MYIVGYNSVADNTGLSSFVYLLLPPKYEKCVEIPVEFDFTEVQGHPRSFILVSNCNFSRIYYHFRDVHA